jgi:hypothetical protein
LDFGPQLQAGDANQDLVFDQFDIVQVSQANRYLSAQPATWGEGDWDAAPGGRPGFPPVGDGRFDQQDIVAALSTGLYLAGSMGAFLSDEARTDGLLAAEMDSSGIGPARVSVPEPSAWGLGILAALCSVCGRVFGQRAGFDLGQGSGLWQIDCKSNNACSGAVK